MVGWGAVHPRKLQESGRVGGGAAGGPKPGGGSTIGWGAVLLLSLVGMGVVGRVSWSGTGTGTEGCMKLLAGAWPAVPRVVGRLLWDEGQKLVAAARRGAAAGERVGVGVGGLELLGEGV